MEHVVSTPARMVKLVQGLGKLGERAMPPRTTVNDANIGCRLDFGPTIKKGEKEYKKYYLQLNKNASDPSLRKLAEKDSHKVWSEAEVEIKPNPTPEEAKAAFEDVCKQLEENMKKP